MIITISGVPQAGKSTLVKNLMEHYGGAATLVSGSQLYRAAVSARDEDELASSLLGETTTSIHNAVDAVLIMRVNEITTPITIVESRTAHKLLENADVRFYIKVNNNVLCSRLGGVGSKQSRDRLLAERTSYQTAYGFDIHDETGYDEVIDASFMSPQQLCQKVLEIVNEYRAK